MLPSVAAAEIPLHNEVKSCILRGKSEKEYLFLTDALFFVDTTAVFRYSI